ncbi:MAG: hypothetical protein JW891_02530 [Candidatus Lokiarchaeota archaeon]|nr:hypothetical protein [Candidatus Lokiarchaeota archaeon]
MSETINLQLCRFCEKTTKLTYYCETCGSSCCSDCLFEKQVEYYTCYNCKKEVQVEKKEDKLVCKECGKEQISVGIKYKKACPKCKSHTIINIYEKKEELEQHFLKYIKDVRKFAQPFLELKRRLEDSREHIKKARDPPIMCFHYPTMESEMVMLFKMFNDVINSLLDRINMHLHHFSLNQDYFFDIYSQPNSSLRVIQDILNNLERSYKGIEEYISSNEKEITKKLDKIDKDLKIADYVTKYFLYFAKDLKLAREERPVYAIAAKLDNGYNPQPLSRPTRGYLFITNLDISFVHTHKIGKKRTKLILKIPIKDLQDIKPTVAKFKKRKIYLEFTYGKYEFLVRNEAIPKLIECIILAPQFGENIKLNKEAADKLQRMVLDVNNIVNFIEEAINSFFSLKCRYNQKVGERVSLNFEKNPFNSIQNPNFQPNSQQMINNSPSSMYSCSQNQQIHQAPVAENQFIFNNQRPQYSGFGTYSPNIDEDKSVLIRQLGRQQGNPQTHQSSPINPRYTNGFYPSETFEDFPYNTEWFHKAGLNRSPKPNDAPFIHPTYENYNKYHLSDYFVPNPRGEDIGKRMRVLKKEQFNLNNTLNKLEARFEQGLLAEDEYFNIYGNIQKRIASIEKKIELLKNDLHEEI